MPSIRGQRWGRPQLENRRCRSCRAGCSVAARTAGEVLIVAPGAATQHSQDVVSRVRILSAIARIVFVILVLGAGPLPDIAGHIQAAVWTLTCWINPNRRGRRSLSVHLQSCSSAAAQTHFPRGIAARQFPGRPFPTPPRWANDRGGLVSAARQRQ